MLRRTFLILLLLSAFTAPSGAVTLEDIDADHYQNAVKRIPRLTERRPPLIDVDMAIQYLMGLEAYSSVSAYEQADGTITLKAVPLKRVAEIHVTGNEVFDDDEVALALGLKVGSKFDSGRILEAGERLKEYYGRAGYFNAIVSFGFEDLKKNDLRVNVKIRERKPCLITEVRFLTENAELRAKLERQARQVLKEKFTEEAILELEENLNEYLRDNRFINTLINQKEAQYNSSKSEVRLVYEVTDPYAYEFILSGQKQFNSAKIIKEAHLSDLPQGSIDPGQDLTDRIRSFYIQSGFPHIRAQYKENVRENKFLKQIYIDIDEGAKVKIAALDIVGRISRPAEYYSEFIKENSSESVQDGYYVKADLENGFKNLTIHLNNQGFIRAKIQSSRVEYNSKKDSVTITVVMDEGPLTQLSQIDFVGVQSFAIPQLLEVIKIKPNAPLRLNELESSIATLKKFYQDRGFIEMHILNNDDSLVQYDERNLNAKVIFRISEGPQVYIKSILIDGNSFTRDYVVLREAGLSSGDLVTPELLDETKKRLDKLAIFSRVEIKTLEANTSLSQRTLVIVVTERNPGLLKFGAGITNKRDLTARGFAGLSYNNIGGTARAVSLRGTVENNLVHENYLEYEASIGYLEPFLFDRRLRGRASYTRSEKIIEPTENDEKISATDEIKFVLEKDLTSKIKFSWLFWGFESVEQFDLPSSGPLVRESRQEIAYIGPSLDVDYRDNPFLPTTGTFTKLDLEYSAPEIGSSDGIQFVRTQGAFTHYWPVWRRKVVWANSLRAGYEKNISTVANSGIPYSFAFFLGGYSTIRGYSGYGNDRIPAERELPTLDRDDQLVIPDESTYYLGKSEIRFPLWQDPFGAVVFYDAGQVDVQGYTFEKPFRQSYGVGLRVNTPVGPLSLDYARKIAPLDIEDKDHWHLSIGTF